MKERIKFASSSAHYLECRECSDEVRFGIEFYDHACLKKIDKENLDAVAKACDAAWEINR